MKGTVYHSQAYLRVKNRNSYTVAYTEDMWSSKALLNIFLVYVPTQLLLSHLHTWKVKFYNRLQDSTELEAKAYFSNMNAHCIARNEVNRSLIQLGGGEFPLHKATPHSCMACQRYTKREFAQLYQRSVHLVTRYTMCIHVRKVCFCF